MSISIRKVTKRYKRFHALDDISLEIPEGQLVALLGPSGSGKTTLLRIIAGLDQPDSGSVLFHGADAGKASIRDRKVGFVFQHYALFRHMTIFDNVAFGLAVRPRESRPSKADINDKVHRLLEMVQLDWCADRYPHQLSGGQRQRIALARALAVEPSVLLLDEPFGALDAKVRAELRRWLRRLHDDTGITSVFVTHDQEEAMEVSDRVVVINNGKVEQEGTPADIYDHPASPFVFQFIGNVNLFQGRVHQGWANVGGVKLEMPEHGSVEDAPAIGYVRPHDVVVTRHNDEGSLAATIRHIHAIGPLARVELTPQKQSGVFEAQMPSEVVKSMHLEVGETVYVAPRKVKVFIEPSPGSSPPPPAT
ncbi:MAG: sulfate ABC transporter ATP-binding protein [Planctomycetes bacterium]|nr:sulfate ABC transporter ATP-binding protein [Planctomycetota bacterium]